MGAERLTRIRRSGSKMARNLSRRAAPGKQSRRKAAIGSLDMDRNRLGEETSPYLLQHKDNPVQWQAWGPDALAAAKAEDKPILLSIGYAACHWCHVMAHESFEKPAIAAQMNERFINVKVDREERPDLDAIYQNALALMGEQGGWPLTMFLTPEGEPFWGGTYDHLGGGFARYSTDARWLAPHFEKMLYDNAELTSLLTLVWQETRDPLYAQRVAETIGWLEREMTHPEGGFYSSLDADSEGEEGKFYVWSEAEIDAVLGERAPLFKCLYDVTAEGNWEGHNILNRLNQPELADENTEAELAQCRALLLQARAPRIRPGLDDKILADWNGLMIAALVEAGLAFDHAGWIALATRAFAFIRGKMTGEDGRLRHSWREGRARHPASVDDYANLSRAALAVHEATSDPVYLDQAKAWVAVLDRHYWDNAGGGYFFAADDTTDLIARAKTASDAAVPAGNGTMAGVLARLALLTGDDAYRRRAAAILGAFSGELGG